ncbi:hypothetical protein MMC31_008046 [Peltigera leucophlebia]|nr:hypothetical protein [Peltigera leucophlebia]
MKDLMGFNFKSVLCLLAVAGATNASFKRQESVSSMMPSVCLKNKSYWKMQASNISTDNLSASSASPTSVPTTNTESASDVSAISTSTGGGSASSISAGDPSATSTATDASAPTTFPSSSTSFNSSQITSATTTLSLDETSPSVATPVAADADLADEVKKCHRPSSNTTNPFCTPKDGQNITATKNYPAIWDPIAFPGPNNTIEIQFSAQNNDSTGVTTNTSAVNSAGFAIISLKNWYSSNKSEIATQNITLSLINKLDNGTEIRHIGPSLIVINTPALKSPSKKLGIKVGLPIAILLIAAGMLLICLCCRKKRRGAVANIVGGRPDYLTKGSRSQHIPAAGGGGFSLNENDISAAPSGSQNRFRDYPEGGGSVELQDRAKSTRTTGSGVGGRNVFRDEIDRQRGRERPPVEDSSHHHEGGGYDAWR